MDWADHTHTIQEEYFRPGPYAYLWIDYSQVDHLLTWCFTFMDLGMYHSISSHARVKCDDQGVYTVDGKHPFSREQAIFMVFSGYYAHFIVELYRDLGISI